MSAHPCCAFAAAHDFSCPGKLPELIAAEARVAELEAERDALLAEQRDEWNFQFVEAMKAKCNSCALVERLEAERDRLREALERIEAAPRDPAWNDSGGWEMASLFVVIAREALGEVKP